MNTDHRISFKSLTRLWEFSARKKRERGERGMSLVGMSVAITVALILLGAGGYVAYTAIKENALQSTLQTIAETGHSAAVEAMTNFDESDTIEAALDGVKQSSGEEDLVLDYAFATEGVADGTLEICVSAAAPERDAEGELTGFAGSCDGVTTGLGAVKPAAEQEVEDTNPVTEILGTPEILGGLVDPNDRVALGWNAVAGAGEYNLQQRERGGESAAWENVPGRAAWDSTRSLTSLEMDAEHMEYRVQARSATDTEVRSVFSKKSIDAAAPKPVNPDSVVLDSTGGHINKLDWDDVDGVQEYVVRTGRTLEIAVDGSDENTHVITGGTSELTNFRYWNGTASRQMYWEIAAKNKFFESALTEERSETLIGDPNIRITEFDGNTVSYSIPRLDGSGTNSKNSGKVSWKVGSRTGENSVDVTKNPRTGSFEIASLGSQPVTITADLEFKGDSGRDSIKSYVGDGATAQNLAAPTGLQVVSANYNSVNLSWNAVSGATGYEIQYRVGSGSYTTVRTVGAVTGTSGLVVSGDGAFRISAIASGSVPKRSLSSAAVSFDILKTSTLTATLDATYGDATALSWGAVPTATSYRIEYRNGTTGEWERRVESHSSTSYTFNPVPYENTQYRITAKRGTNFQSAPFRSSLVRAQAPSQVTSGVVWESTGDDVVITWPKQSNVRSYEVRYQHHAESAKRSVLGGTWSTTGESKEFTIWREGYFVSFQIVAKNNWTETASSNIYTANALPQPSISDWRYAATGSNLQYEVASGTQANSANTQNKHEIKWMNGSTENTRGINNPSPTDVNHAPTQSIGTGSSATSFKVVTIRDEMVENGAMRISSKSQESASQAVPPTPAPTGVIFDSMTRDGNMTVSWDSISSVSYYNAQENSNSSVRVSKQSGSRTTITGDWSNTADTSFKVRAYYADGKAQSELTREGFKPLASPSNLTVSTVTPGDRVNISWAAVTGAQGYELLARSKGSGNFVKVAGTSGTKTSYTGLDLPYRDTDYHVVAMKSGSSSLSIESPVSAVEVGNATAPPVPTGMKLSAVGRDFTVSWNAQVSGMTYDVRVSDQTNLSSNVTTRAGVSGTSVSFTDWMAANTTKRLTFDVTSKNRFLSSARTGVGGSATSGIYLVDNVVASIPLIDGNQISTKVSTNRTGLGNSSSIDVTHTIGGTKHTRTITRANAQSNPNAGNTTTIAGIDAGVTISTVATYEYGGASNWYHIKSNPSTAVNKNSVPVPQPKHTGSEAYTHDLSWLTKEADTGGTAATHFRVERSSSQNGPWEVLADSIPRASGSASTTQNPYEGLVTEYSTGYARVTGLYMSGSNPIRISTPKVITLQGVSVPNGVSVTVTSGNRLDVSWNRPQWGFTATHYDVEVEYRTASGTATLAPIKVNSSSSAPTRTGILPGGVVNKVRVKAYKSSTERQFASSWSAQTSDATLTIDSPTGGKVTGVGTSNTFSWGASQHASRYEVQRKLGTGSWTNVNKNVSGTQLGSISGSTSQTVQFRVRAVLKVGSASVYGDYLESLVFMNLSTPTMKDITITNGNKLSLSVGSSGLPSNSAYQYGGGVRLTKSYGVSSARISTTAPHTETLTGLNLDVTFGFALNTVAEIDRPGLKLSSGTRTNTGTALGRPSSISFNNNWGNVIPSWSSVSGATRYTSTGSTGPWSVPTVTGLLTTRPFIADAHRSGVTLSVRASDNSGNTSALRTTSSGAIQLPFVEMRGESKPGRILGYSLGVEDFSNKGVGDFSRNSYMQVDGGSAVDLGERYDVPGGTGGESAGVTVRVYGKFSTLSPPGFTYNQSTGLGLVSIRGLTTKEITSWQSESGIKDLKNLRLLTKIPTNLPTSVTDLSYTFAGDPGAGVSATVGHSMRNWDVGYVTTTKGMFKENKNFNGMLQWGTSSVNVRDMSYMFDGATAFNNGSLAALNFRTDFVLDASYMFRDATSFNRRMDSSATSSGWSLNRVKTAKGMFQRATKFNQRANLLYMPRVEDLSYMFDGATAFNNGNAYCYNPESPFCGALRTINPDLKNASYMFRNAKSFVGDHTFLFSIADFSSVTNASNMFQGAVRFNADITAALDFTAVENLSYMFDGATSFNNGEAAGVAIPTSEFNLFKTGSAANMSFMFRTATSFNQNIRNWDTGKVTSMKSMFAGAARFNQPLASWNTSNVTDMRSMFSGAARFNQPLASWNTSNVTDMRSMFSGAARFNRTISSWNVNKVTKYKASYFIKNTHSSMTAAKIPLRFRNFGSPVTDL